MPFTGPKLSRTRSALSTSSLLSSLLKGRDKRRNLKRDTHRSSETLEDRALLTHAFDVLFAPDTPQSVIDEHLAEHAEEHGEDPIGHFNADGAWGSTATNGSGLGQGDPRTLTWSIAPDGTDIPGFNGEPPAPSDLISFLEGIYGADSPGDGDLTNEPWFNVIADSLNRWSEISGLRYIYEAADDGEAFSNRSGDAPGVLGVRGDVRIGGHFIDGNSGVLAYNFFPDNGEMVIDTADNFYVNNSGGSSLGNRNVFAHEAGHGFGLSHVVSSDSRFLMEPFLSTAFDGPQLDDVLGVQRIHGDAFEFADGNETTGDATPLGTILDGQTVTLGADATDTVVAATDTDFVSIDDNSDIDVFSFTVTTDSLVDISVDPVGPTYSQGRQGTGSESPFNVSNQSDLTFEVLSGNTVLVTSNSAGLGGTESLTDIDLEAGEYFVRITGAQDSIQLYQLDVSVTANVAASTVSIAANNATQAEGDSGTTNFTFDVTRSGDLSATGTVAWALAGTGANPANAADFGGSLPSGTVTFDPGVGTQTITVAVAGDVVVEEDEEFTITLSNPSAGVSIVTATAAGTIQNDDTSLSIAATDAVKAEGDSGTTPFTFTVTRNGDTSGATTVDFRTTTNGNPTVDANDFPGGLPTGSVSFAAGETTQTITINVAGDTETEPSESFQVSLENPSSGVTLATSSAHGQILNDDSFIVISAADASKNEGDSGSTAFTFTVVRNGSTAGVQTVDYAVTSNSADGQDFTGGALPSGTVTFADGQNLQTLTINVAGDNDVEADEDFTVTLSNASGGTEIRTNSADGTIQNDDVQIDIELLANQASLAEGDSGSTAFTFLVTRTGATDMQTTVDFAVLASSAANAADFTGGALPSGTVTFAVGETEQTITINVAGDTLAEADEAFTVGLSNANNGEIITGTASSTILNDDTNLAITALDVSQNEGDAGDSTVYRFEVTRTGDVSGGATADFNVTGDADAADFGGALPSGTVTFAAGETTQQIDVTVSGDDDIEGDESFTVTLSNALGATITTASASSTIVNDDQPQSGVFIENGVLTVIGNGDNEYVSIHGRRSTISVFTYNYATEARTFDVFNQSDVESISVDVDGGDDQVYLRGRINQDAIIELGDGNDRGSGGRGDDVINGGAGNDAIWGNSGDDILDGGDGNDYIRGGSQNDILRGGAGSDWLYGDSGHDILLGGDDNDVLWGGNGRDIQIGGEGSDWVIGGNSDDVLIGGTTAHDSDNAALTALLDAWTARDSYNNRVNAIRTGAGNLNGIKLEAGTTVFDDDATDALVGQRGRDWFFGDTGGADRDWIFRGFNEVVDALP